MALLFNSKPNLDVQASMFGPHGFDKNKYIDYQLKQQLFFDILIYLLNYFNDKEGKMMILSSKIESTNIIYDYIKENFQEKTISVYNSKISEDDKIKAITSDIISSTPKSAGTGVDIPGLRFEIMTEPYSSKITASQVSGRLREYGPNAYTFYIELIDTGFKKVYDMYKKRLPVFKKKCVTILEHKYDENNHV
jgi:superfamily II DNA or RNA helicase